MIFDIDLIKNNIPQLLWGIKLTLTIAFLSGAMGIILGTLIGFMQTSSHFLLRALAKTYVTIIRGVPMILQILFMYYGVFSVLEIHWSSIYAAIIAIGMNSGAYVSQIIRSGIQAVGQGQIEAAQVLGLSNWNIKRYVVFPQALRVVLPALGNEFITLVKDSSLASTIGVMELFKVGRNIAFSGYDAITVYLAVGLVYLILTSILSLIVNALERKMNHHVAS